MARYVAVFVVVLSLNSLAVAQNVDRAALRKCAMLPTTDLVIELNASDVNGSPALIANNRPTGANAAKKRELLEKRLKGSIEDAWVLYEMIREHGTMEFAKKDLELWSRIEKLLRPHLAKSTNPRNGCLFGLYARALEETEPKKYAEAAKWAQLAVQHAPDDSRSWRFLGSLCLRRVMAALTEDIAAKKGLSPRECIQFLDYRESPSKSCLATAERFMKEAHSHFEVAFKIAPNDSEQISDFVCCLRVEFELRKVLQGFRNGIASAEIVDAVLASELRRLARALPNHVGLQYAALNTTWGVAFCQDVKIATARIDGVSVMQNGVTFRSELDRGKDLEKRLDANTKRELRDLIANLDRLGDEATGDAANNAINALCLYYNLIEDSKAVEREARRVLKRVPENPDASRILAWALSAQKRVEEAVAVARPTFKACPTAILATDLSNDLVRINLDEEAEAVLRKGLKENPDDVPCLISLAGVLIRRDEKAETIAESLRLLNHAALELGPGGAQDLAIACEFNQALCWFLSGEPLSARTRLERLQKRWPDSEKVKKAVALICPP